jgi:hypothetical protein
MPAAVRYAWIVQDDGKRGAQVVASDSGPGISSIEQAMQVLPSVRRLMDEMKILSDRRSEEE